LLTPYPIDYFIPGMGNANLTGSDQPARIVVTCDPGQGWSGDPVRLDPFSALNHTQFTGVDNTAVFAGLSDWTVMNPAYGASGNVVRNDGFGSISGRRTVSTMSKSWTTLRRRDEQEEAGPDPAR
jgi:hypothetical protein